MAEENTAGYSTNDDEELRLLNDGGDAEKKKSAKQEGQSGASTWLKMNLKLLIGVLSVLALVVLGVVVGAVSNNHTKNKLGRLARNEFPYPGLRLPGDLEPLKYRIYLHPNLTTFSVFGSTRILFRCVKPTKKVILNFKDNTISDIRLLKNSYLDKPFNNEDLLVKGEFSTNQEKELLVVQTEKDLEVGQNYTLVVLYNGTLQETLQGFYRSSYKTKAGETRYIATTHFESSAARTAFPCFDEPAMKATFRIIIVKSPQHTATSNMPVLKTKTRHDGLEVVHFEESVKMSTYVVAFVVHDFKSLDAVSSRGIKIKIIVPEDQINQAAFARETTPKVLDFYEKFFKIDFPLSKLDLIAIPDFAAGAMENWGLITYRMTSLLYDEKESSDSNKQRVAIYIAHEIAHQWFGNLVTMDWWNDLWLNEGFASYMQYYCTDKIFKEWQMMDQFVISHVQRSLIMDAHTNSHPISVPVKDPKEINAIFDAISYQKGASIISMLKGYLGSKEFDTGLQSYLNVHQFANAKSDDLWSSLTKATGNVVDVKALMDTWTLQMGFPVVTLKKDAKNAGKCFVTQRQFLTAKDAKPSKSSPFGYKWDIPVTYMTKSARDVVLFNRSIEQMEFPCPKPGEWIKINIDTKGFFRTNYYEENWKLLSTQLLNNHTIFSSSDRANLIDDSFELARTDMLSYETALDLTKYFNKEQDYVPWNSLMSSLGYISSMLEGRPGYTHYEKYVLKIIQPLVQKLEWKDTGTHLQKYLRGLILGSAVKHNETSAKTKALEMFRDFKKNGKPIPPNLKGSVYAAGIKYGTEDDWKFLLQRRETTLVSSEKSRILYSLSETEDPKILKNYLEMALDSSKVRAQDSASVIIGVSANKVGRKLAWDFAMKNWDTIYERYSSISFTISKVIKATFGSGKTVEERDMVKNFFKTHKTGTGKRALNQALENIQNHIDWLSRYEKIVVEWLKKQV